MLRNILRRVMKKILTTFSAFIAILAVAGVVVVTASSSPVHAADDSNATKAEVTKESDTKDATSVKDYTYTANSGDTYTAMVRKAVQTYGINNDIELGEARIVYIETMMTQAAASPYLWVGQKITIKGSDVKNWADKSLELNDKDVAAWQTYVAYINFNTNHVGE